MKVLDWILLVDDDEIDRFINEKIISQCDVDYPVYSVHDGYGALEWIDKKVHDIVSKHELGLIILDINMPGMSGFEFLEVYNLKYPQLKEFIEIVTLSSSNHRLDKERMFDLGAKSYYSKPLNHEDFRKILDKSKDEVRD